MAVLVIRAKTESERHKNNNKTDGSLDGVSSGSEMKIGNSVLQSLSCTRFQSSSKFSSSASAKAARNN